MPLRTQQRIQTDEPQRQKRSITIQSDALQTAAQCHLEAPRATVWGIKVERKQPRGESRAGVAHISAGVHSGYQMVRGDIRLRHMHTLRSSPGEREGNMSLCLLILFSPHN